MAKRRFKLINAPVSALEINDLTAAVTWANVPDVNITESSVLQHQSALTILESQITDGSILARIAANETITGAYTFTGGVTLTGGNLVAGTIDADFDELSVTNVQFDLNFTDGNAEGRLQWNIEDGTLEVGMPGGNVNLQIGQETMIRARNTTGVLIADGSPVYITGASGNKPLIALADATNLATSDVLGIATEDIANNDNGFVTLSGLVRNVNTAGMIEGDKLWLSETAGAFTITQPSSPAQKVRIGHVIAVSATVGTIHVALTPGIELSHISDSGLNNDLLHRVANVWVPSAGALTFDGTDLVCSGDISGLTIGGIVQANLLDRTVNEIVTGRWDFESDGSAPQLCIVDSDSNGAATRAFIEYLGKGDVLTGRMGYLTATSGIFTIDNALPNAGIELTNAGVQKLRIDINGVFMSDDTDVAGALTATSYNGILAANLLDKSAVEIITGKLQVGAGTPDAVRTFNVVSPDIVAMNIDGTNIDGVLLDIVGAVGATNSYGIRFRDDAGGFSFFGWDVAAAHMKISTGRATAAWMSINSSGDLLATSYAGVLAANLLDKAASETVSDVWTHTQPLILSEADPTLRMIESDASADNGLWEIRVQGEQFAIRAINDAFTADNKAITIDRTGIVIDAVNILAPLTATSFGGILEENLLDKSTSETIGASWLFNGSLFMLEKTSAATDQVNYGQLFIKNTSPQEFWFASDDGVEHHVAGGSLAETFGQNKTANEGVLNSTIMQNDDHLAINVSNGRFYTIIMVLEINTLGTPSGDFKFQFTVPGGSTGSFSWHNTNSGGTAFTDVGASASWTTAQTGVQIPTSGSSILVLHGTFTAGADGTFQLQWAQNSATLADTQVLKGSSLNLISG